MKTSKKFISVFLALLMIISIIPMSSIAASAATFEDINQSSVFLKQPKGSVTCTLVAATMMVRRAAMINGNSNWASITESSMKSTAWTDSGGLWYSFTYAGISVKHANLTGGSSNTSTLISLLNQHPEGIVLYKPSYPTHAVLLTDYTNGVFYCSDPGYGTPTGRIPISSAAYVTISNATEYWYVSSPKCTLTTNIPTTGVSLNSTSFTLEVGQTETLTATVTPSNATDKSVTWSSSNTNVATVSSSGVVTAKAGGTCTITATTSGGQKATATVTVNNILTTGITLDTNAFTLEVEQTKSLIATVTPSNATDKSVTWNSNDTSVATVSSSGVVTAKSGGTCTITVTTSNGQTDEMSVYVDTVEPLNHDFLTSDVTYIFFENDDPTEPYYAEEYRYYVPEEDGQFVYGVEGDAYTELRLYDENWNELACAFGCDGYDVKCELKCNLEAGKKYYFRADLRFEMNDSFTVNYSFYKMCKLTYRSNFGEVLYYDSIEPGEEIVVDSCRFSYSGYSFIGWSRDSLGTYEMYQPGETITIDSDLTLYAIWTPNEYTVSYNANGGTGAPASQTKVHDITLTLSNTVPTLSGYTFLGWSESSTATTATYSAGSSFTANANTTLYAVWQENVVVVPEVHVSSTSVNLTLGETESTDIYAWATGVTCSYTVQYQIADTSIVSCAWGEWDSENKSPLTITAKAKGTTTVTVSVINYETKEILDSIVVTVNVGVSSSYVDFSIKEPSTATIRYKDGIVLHIDGQIPDGARVEWAVDNNNFDGGVFDNGMSCLLVSKNNGYTTVVATLYDANDNVLATDSIEMRSKAGFFDKIGGFFRSLFGSTKIYDN